jgi:hypothetical protein
VVDFAPKKEFEMTNQEIENKLAILVKSERKITNEILILIREGENRRLYIEAGFSSTHEWLIKKYGYSQSAANRRIQASRLLSAVPEISEKLNEGTVNLTTLTQVQSTIRREEKRSGQRVSREVKRQLVKKIEGKSAEQTQRILVELYPEAQPPKESLRACSAEESRLTVVLDAEATEILVRVRELLSHSHPGASWAEVVKQMGFVFLKAKDPLKKKMTQGFAGTAESSVSDDGKNKENLPEKESARRPIKAAIRRTVLQRGNHSCEFVDNESGRTCASRFQVEVDHIVPVALGGTDELENLRCLCRNHNILEAERRFGREFMDQWRINAN